MNIASQIDTIIDQRQNQAKNVESALKKWENLKQTLRSLENERLKNLNSDTEGKSNLSTRLNNFNLSMLIEQVNEELKNLKNLKKRLSRQTLNIGVVGRMRQGKSTLLKSITGLSDDEIPTSSGGICTKVLSKIFHDPNTIGNDVEFHSWSSFKEIIHLYFDQLGLPGNKPNEKDDINEQLLPFLPKDKAKDENTIHLYGRLRRDYYGQFETYKTLIDEKTKSISKGDIKKYVTQEDTKNSEYLAVKELRIRCRFPQQEVGRIGLIDLPGLGDNYISDVELLIKTLREDIDFVIFVRRPDPVASDWDTVDREMYTIARKALGDFPIKECSLMVFNKIKEQEQKSLEACRRFQDSIEKQEIKVGNTVIADCSDSAAVANDVLLPALKDLTKNINSVYQQYFKLQNERLQKLRSEINQELQKAGKALKGYGEEDSQGFIYWFNKILWENINAAIQNQYDQLEKIKNEDDSEFEQAITSVVDYCNQDNVILTKRNIDNIRSRNQSSWKIAYYICINEVKDKLKDKFKELATRLEESEKKLQLSTLKILSENGELKELTQNQELKFFEEILEKIPFPERPTSKKLINAFKDIQKSTQTYENTILGWIDTHLDELTPDRHIDPISQSQLLGNQTEVSSNPVKTIVSKIFTKDNIINLIKDDLDATSRSQLSNSQIDISSGQIDEITKIVSKIITEKNVLDELETTEGNSTDGIIFGIGRIILAAFGIEIPNGSEELISKISRSIIKQIYPSVIKEISQPMVQPSIRWSNLNTSPLYSSDFLLQEIDKLRKEVVEKCKETLLNKLDYPNSIAYSKYSSFVTEAFFNDYALIGWQDFYTKYQDVLYPKKAQEEKNKEVEERWEGLIKSAVKLNEENTLLLGTSKK
ncbi:MAG: dynamin family protein [Nostoc sp. DedQUE01]